MAVGLGIDVGGTKILGVAIGDDGAVIGESRADSVDAPDPLFGAMATIVEALAEEVTGQSLAGIGVGFPGLVDVDGVVHEAPNLTALEETSVFDALRDRLSGVPRLSSLPLIIDNDGTCAALGEAQFGAIRGVADAIVVVLGTGIGGGIVSEGRILRGGRGFAGELGHIVVDQGGPRCVCGRGGCWEQFVSGSGTARLAREAAAAGRAEAVLQLAHGDIEAIRSEHLFAAARGGDLEAWGVVDVFCRYLALGISNLVEVLDPMAVVIGGSVGKDADVFIDGTLDYFALERRGAGPRAVEIRVAELGERSGAIGAAALVLDR